MSQVFRYWNSFVLPSRTGLTLTPNPYLLQFFIYFDSTSSPSHFGTIFKKVGDQGWFPKVLAPQTGESLTSAFFLWREVSLYVAGALSWWKSSRPLCSTTWLSYLRGQPHRDKGVVFLVWTVNRYDLDETWFFPSKNYVYIIYIIYIYVDLYMVHTWWVFFLSMNMIARVKSIEIFDVPSEKSLSPGQGFLVLCSDLTGKQTWENHGGSMCLLGWFIFFVEGCVGIEVMIWKKQNMLRSTPILGHAAYIDFI